MLKVIYYVGYLLQMITHLKKETNKNINKKKTFFVERCVLSINE